MFFLDLFDIVYFNLLFLSFPRSIRGTLTRGFWPSLGQGSSRRLPGGSLTWSSQ